MNKRKEEMQILAEEACVGERQPNGEVENGSKSVQSQTKTTRLALRAMSTRKIRTDHVITPWEGHHSALLIDVCRNRIDRGTPYEGRKGKKHPSTPS